MDYLNDFRAVMTVVSFVTFLGIVFWAYSGRRKRAFEEAANLPFDHDDVPAQAERKAS